MAAVLKRKGRAFNRKGWEEGFQELQVLRFINHFPE